MSVNGGDVIAGALREQGKSPLFTLCGGHISPILAGCNRLGIPVIDTRNEATAVFAADAYSRISGDVGVAAVTAGPGVTNCVTALKNAQMAQSPLVLLAGSTATVIKGRGALQDIDHIKVIAPLVKWAATLTSSCDIVSIVEKAFSHARSGVPGPVFIECPIDLLYDEDLVRLWYGRGMKTTGKPGLMDRIKEAYVKRHVDRMYACDLNEARPRRASVRPRTIGEAILARAAIKIKEASRPLVLLGSQATLDRPSLFDLPGALARLGIPVYCAGMARGLLGERSGLQLMHHRRQALEEADLVILGGIPCDFRLEYGKSINTGAFVISINRSRRDLYLNRRPDLAVQADAGMFLVALAGRLAGEDAARSQWLDHLKKRDHERETEILSKSLRKSEYINPLLLLKKLDEFLDENATIVVDGGDFAATAAYILHPRAPLSWLDPGAFGTLGVGAGFALGARCARPAAEAWIIYGDGAAGYSLQEIDTMARHRLPAIALIGNDGVWTQIARDQVDILKDDVGTRLRRSDYHLVAAALGGEGFLLEREEDIERVLYQARQAARRGRPVVINALIGTTDFRKGSVSL
jgi:acetolactate synthase-1/2/3 large subunit